MSRDTILAKLRHARQPFPDAPPRPKDYLPVTRLDDDSPGALLDRFTEELETLNGEVFVVPDERRACDKVLELLRAHEATAVLAWDFQYIPAAGLEQKLRDAGIEIHLPDIHQEERQDSLTKLAEVSVGLTGADAAAATTATLIVSTGPGKGRIPTVLPPVHLVVLRQDQILPRLEDWVAAQQADGHAGISAVSNLCFISGPSRTADIEKNLVLGMHGPGQLQVVVISG